VLGADELIAGPVDRGEERAVALVRVGREIPEVRPVPGEPLEQVGGEGHLRLQVGPHREEEPLGEPVDAVETGVLLGDRDAGVRLHAGDTAAGHCLGVVRHPHLNDGDVVPLAPHAVGDLELRLGRDGLEQLIERPRHPVERGERQGDDAVRGGQAGLRRGVHSPVFRLLVKQHEVHVVGLERHEPLFLRLDPDGTAARAHPTTRMTRWGAWV
jgi:hypothetical protein